MPLASKAEQRRGAFRQEVAVIPRLARVIYTDVAQRRVRVGVTDISATGLRIRSQDEMRVGDLLELAFDADGEVHVHARVRRVSRHERFWAVGCAFEGVTERLADQIVKFVFAQQRSMLRKVRGDR